LASLEEDNLVVFCFLCTSEVWPDKRGLFLLRETIYYYLLHCISLHLRLVLHPIRIIRGRYETPPFRIRSGCRDWPIGFKGGKGTPSWINLNIITIRGRICTPIAWMTPRRDWPIGCGYIKIYSTETAFAALKADGSITVWGDSSRGGLDAPFGRGYTKIHSTAYSSTKGCI
jgi:hypothetical protein